MADFDWKTGLTGMFGGIAGDPMLGMRQQMAQFNMMMQMEQAQQRQAEMERLTEETEIHKQNLKRLQAETKLKQMGWEREEKERAIQQQEEQEPINLMLPGPMEQITQLPWGRGQVKETEIGPSGEPKIGMRKETMPMGKAKSIFGQKLPEAMYPGFGQKPEKPGKAPAEPWLNELKQFEAETGTPQEMRGSTEYQDAIAKWREKKKVSPASVNVNVDLGMEKSTKAKLEQELIPMTQRLDSLLATKEMYKDQFSRASGQAKAKGQELANWVGIETDTEFMEKRSAWYSTAKIDFLEHRKHITGVAGGPAELADIAKSWPDPEKDPPAKYKSKMSQTIKNLLRMHKRYRMFIDNGIKPTKEQLSTIPYSSIKLNPEEEKMAEWKEFSIERVE